jgi:ATP-dependent RNA helicase DDX60
LLVKLLESDEMKDLCLQFSHNKEEVSKKIMSLLIHLFKRVKVSKEQRAIADPMDKGFEKIILDYNEKVMQSFIEYFTLYADNELLDDSDSMTLPMSKICFFKKDSTLKMDSSLLNPVKIRSPFIAMSGSGDSFSSVEDVFKNIRSDIYFEKSMIPIMNVDSNISGYALSFYTSGKANILVEKYQLQGKRIYDMLKEWVLFLKVIVRTLENVSKKPKKEKIQVQKKEEKEEEDYGWEDLCEDEEIEVEDEKKEEIEIENQVKIHKCILEAFKYLLNKMEDNFISESETNFDDFFQKAQNIQDSLKNNEIEDGFSVE